MSGLFIGIDVGGTNLKSGVTDEAGLLLASAHRPLKFRGAEPFAADLAALAEEVLQAAGGTCQDVVSVGIGLPGAVSGGEVLFTPNIPLAHVPLAELFRSHMDVPVLLGNDADCAAVGEYFQGAGRGVRDFVVLTLGTEGSIAALGDTRARAGIFPVQAVDTTAAGDTFTGYFLRGILDGAAPEACLRLASAASALAVTRPGAADSVPAYGDVLDFLKQN